MAEIHDVDFNALPGPTRERLLACINRKAAPEPLLAEKSSYVGAIVGWIFLLVIALGGLLLAIFVDFGELYGSGNIAHPAMILVYALIVFVTAFAFFSAIRRIVLQKTLPYPPGRYLFPTDFVDARTSKLRVIPIALLSDVKAVHHHTNGAYTHTQFGFDFKGAGTIGFQVKGKPLAEQVLQTFWQYQAAIGKAVELNDTQTVASYDPFFDVRMRNLWNAQPPPAGVSDPAPRARVLPAVFRFRAVLALVLGLVVAVPLWLVRNVASDTVMFASAKRIDSESGYKAYASSGWFHVDEAKAAAPVAAFKEAKDSVSKLRAVLKTYPNSSVDAQVKAAIHDLYAKSLGEFRKSASSRDPKMLPFVEKLINYVEQNESPDIVVRFRRPTSESLALADRELQKEVASQGRSFVPIAPHFTEKNEGTHVREETIVTNLNDGFRTIFPAELLEFKKGDRLEGAALSPSELTTPTIEIDYDVGSSGSYYTETSGTRTFVGLSIGFDMNMRIPKREDRFGFQLSVEPPTQFSVSYSGPSGSSGPSEGQVYDTMAARAFDQFSAKLRGVFFKDGSTAPVGREKSGR